MRSPLSILADFGNQLLCFRKMLLSGRLPFLEDLRQFLVDRALVNAQLCEHPQMRTNLTSQKGFIKVAGFFRFGQLFRRQ